MFRASIKNVAYLSLVLVLVLGCRKETPPAIDEDVAPVIAQNLNIDLPSDVSEKSGVLVDVEPEPESALSDPHIPAPSPTSDSASPVPPPEPAPAPPTLDTVDSTDYLGQGGTYWDALYVGSNHVGYQSTNFSFKTLQEKPVLCVEIRSQLKALRIGVPIELETAIRSFETRSGELIGCQSKTLAGNVLIEHLAKVVGKNLNTTTILGDNTQESQLPWNPGAGTGGYAAIQISLWKNSIQDQEERRVAFYDPSNRSPVDAVLAAQEIESVDVLGKRLNLRKVEALLRYAQQPIPFTFWVDAKGNIVLMSTPFIGEEQLISIRTSEEEAKKNWQTAPTLDIGKMPLVPLAKPIADPNGSAKLTFRVKTKAEPFDAKAVPLTVFPNTPYQSVKFLDPVPGAVSGAVEITVLSAIGNPTPADVATAPPASGDTAPNQWVNSDDPAIREMAALAVPKEGTNREKAIALEKYVHEKLTPDYTFSGFESAAEVAKSLRGDCTAYAFLLAALARSQGIPTRLVVGFVYTELKTPGAAKQGALTFHLWDECYLEDRWVPFDATQGLGGANAARIQIADSDLESTSFVFLASQILKLAGNLEIELIEP